MEVFKGGKADEERIKEESVISRRQTKRKGEGEDLRRTGGQAQREKTSNRRSQEGAARETATIKSH